MTDGLAISRNAQVGAIALALSATLGAAIIWRGPGLVPLRIVALFGTALGLVCLCDELGAGRPLNRAGLILFAGAFCAKLLMLVSADPLTAARATITYAFAMFGALLLWSVALLHHSGAAKRMGALGTAASIASIAFLIAGHLAVALGSLAGFAGLYAALDGSAEKARSASVTIETIAWLWCLAASGLLWHSPID